MIVGVVLSVLLPPVGLIICLVCLNDIKKNNKQGKNLATNGIMVSILMTIVLIVGSIGLVIYHNKEEEKEEQTEKYERELKKVCESLDAYDEYETYYHKSGATKYPDNFMKLVNI